MNTNNKDFREESPKMKAYKDRLAAQKLVTTAKKEKTRKSNIALKNYFMLEDERIAINKERINRFLKSKNKDCVIRYYEGKPFIKENHITGQFCYY